EHLERLKLEHPQKSKVELELNIPENEISETLRWLAHGPRCEVKKFSGYTVNGSDYHTKAWDNEHVQQNSGVTLQADALLVSSAKDRNPKEDEMTFYG
ncbi:hypothetical protein ABKV19_026006, partial [Rosa sericea]